MIAFAPIPLTYWAGATLTALVAIQSQQNQRIPLLAIFLAFVWLTFSNILTIFPNPDHASCFGLFLLIWSSHTIHVLFVEKHVVTLPHSPTPTTTTFPQRASTISSSWNWRAAYKMLYNSRWVDTRNISPDVPAPRRYKSRASFLISRFLSAAAIYTFHHCYALAVSSPAPFNLWAPFSSSDFYPEKEYAFRRFGEMTLRENGIRLFFIFHFIWTAYSELEFVHHAHAFIAVGIGYDDPEDWPPLYGSVKETYSLRRFWGRFWHRLVYRCYGSYGRLFSNEVLGIKKGTALDRVVCNGMVFFLSGCVHGAVTWRLGISCGYWEDVWWFMACFAGIYFEEVFFALVTTMLGKSVWRRPAMKTWGRVLGYCWVLAWFWWTLPKTMFPKLRCLPPEVLQNIQSTT